MVKHNQTIRQQQPANCLSVFDHFVSLALKVLNSFCLKLLLYFYGQILQDKPFTNNEDEIFLYMYQIDLAIGDEN